MRFNQRKVSEEAMSNYTKDPEAIASLSPEQYRVTQQSGTERPFDNAYWDHDEPGFMWI